MDNVMGCRPFDEYIKYGTLCNKQMEFWLTPRPAQGWMTYCLWFPLFADKSTSF